MLHRGTMAKAMHYNVAGGLQGMLKEGTKTYEGEAGMEGGGRSSRTSW